MKMKLSILFVVCIIGANVKSVEVESFFNNMDDLASGREHITQADLVGFVATADTLITNLERKRKEDAVYGKTADYVVSRTLFVVARNRVPAVGLMRDKERFSSRQLITGLERLAEMEGLAVGFVEFESVSDLFAYLNQMPMKIISNSGEGGCGSFLDALLYQNRDLIFDSQFDPDGVLDATVRQKIDEFRAQFGLSSNALGLSTLGSSTTQP